VRAHARTRNAQAEFEAILGELFGRAVPIVGSGLETAGTLTAGVGTPGQRQRVDGLHRIISLPTDLHQPLLDSSCDLPYVGRVADKQRAVNQPWKEVLIVCAEVAADVLVRGTLEVFATNLDRITSSSLSPGVKPPRRMG
jgi:hypothetical protein